MGESLQQPDLSRRFTTEYVKQCLDRIDLAEAGGGGRRSDRRREDRYSYRVRQLSVDVLQLSGEWKRYYCPSRNISAHGVNFLMCHFVYPGTVCQVHLRSIYNMKVAQAGVVRRCTFIEGTLGLHEAGVEFDAPIDVALFHRGAAPTHILIADDDPNVHKLAEALLRDQNAQFTPASSAAQAIELATGREFDMGLIDIAMPEMDGIEAVREIRSRGCVLPLVAITALPDARQRCLEAGFDLYLSKPLNKQNLTSAVTSMKCDPIISSLVHDTNLGEVIEQYVVLLRTRAQELIQLLGAEGNRDELIAAVRDVEVNAASHGFEVVSHAAGELRRLVESSGVDEVARLKARHLARLSRAARGTSFKR